MWLLAPALPVVSAITALPEHQRVAILLRYYQDLSLAEIAETLNIPIGTVKSRLSRASGRLRRVIETRYPWLRPAAEGGNGA